MHFVLGCELVNLNLINSVWDFVGDQHCNEKSLTIRKVCHGGSEDKNKQDRGKTNQKIVSAKTII